MKIRKYANIALVLLMLQGCEQSADVETTVDQELQMIGSDEISGISFDNMDTLIHPGDDFFEYVNGTWLRNTEIPSDKSRYGSFNVLRDNAESDVRAIIEESSASGAAMGSAEQKVGDLFQSYMDMETRNALGLSPLEDRMNAIDAISDLASLSSYLADAGKVSLSTPLALYISVDAKNTYPIFPSFLSGGSGTAGPGILF